MDPATSDTDRPDDTDGHEGTDGSADHPRPADRDASRVSTSAAPADMGAACDGVGAPDEGVTLPAAAARRRPHQLVAAGVALVLGISLLGAPLGLLWAVLAPDVPVVKTEGGAALAHPQPEEFIAADGWFSLLTLAFGVLVALGMWWTRPRWRGPGGMLVAVAGALGAALVAWGLGRQIGLDRYREQLADAPVGHALRKPPDLRAGGFEWLYDVIPTVRGVVLLGAFGAAVTYTLLAGWSSHPNLVPGPAEGAFPAGAEYQPPGTAPYPDGDLLAGEVSSGSPEARDRQTSPAPPGPGEAGPARG